MKLHSIQYILYYEFLAPPPPRTTSVALFMNESDAEDALVCMVSMACTHVYVKIHVVLFFKHCLICSRVQFHIQRIRFIYILNSGSANMDTLIVTVIFKVQYIAVHASILMALQQHTEDRLIGSLTSFMIALILSPRMLNAQFLFTYS